MGACMTVFETTSRQEQFEAVINQFSTGSVNKLSRDAGKDVPQMATGRVCSPNGILTAPVSGSPCVAFYYEISEFHFNGMLPHGFGFTKMFAEKKNIAFEIIDPQFADIRIMIDPCEELIQLEKSSQTPISMEYLSDIALAHVCPVPEYTYDVPFVYKGDIHATKNLLRGYPLKFGMLDGEGDGVRVEVPENIEQLFAKAQISRFKEKSMWRKIRESCGKNYDGDEEFRTFCLTEISIRVNDQVSVVSGFEADSSNPNIFRAVPLSRGQTGDARYMQTIKSVFNLTEYEQAMVVSKFPRVGDCKSLPKGLIWSQEQGVFSNFVLQDKVEQNAKNLDFRAENGSPGARELGSPSIGSPSVTTEQKQSRAYLFTDDANKRLGNQSSAKV